MLHFLNTVIGPLSWTSILWFPLVVSTMIWHFTKFSNISQIEMVGYSSTKSGEEYVAEEFPTQHGSCNKDINDTFNFWSIQWGKSSACKRNQSSEPLDNPVMKFIFYNLQGQRVWWARQNFSGIAITLPDYIGLAETTLLTQMKGEKCIMRTILSQNGT